MPLVHVRRPGSPLSTPLRFRTDAEALEYARSAERAGLIAVFTQLESVEEARPSRTVKPIGDVYNWQDAHMGVSPF